MEAKKGYAASQEGAMAGRTLGNLSDCCNRFLGFLCINGIRSPADISYHILDQYMFDVNQTIRTSCQVERYVEGLLFYMAELGQCSYGLGWYVHFARHGKVPVGDDFLLRALHRQRTTMDKTQPLFFIVSRHFWTSSKDIATLALSSIPRTMY